MIERVRTTTRMGEEHTIAQLLAVLAPEVVPHIVERLDTVAPERLASIQLALLMQCRQRPWQLAGAVRHPRPAVARLGLRILREIDGPKATGELFGGLVHESADVRLEALRAILERHDDRLVDRLPSLLRDVSAAVRLAALGALADLSPADGLRVLGPLFADPVLRARSAEEQAALFKVVTAIGGDEAVAIVAPLVADPEPKRFGERLRNVFTHLFRPRDDIALFQAALRVLLHVDTASAKSLLDTAQASHLRHRRQIVRRARAALARRTP